MNPSYNPAPVSPLHEFVGILSNFSGGIANFPFQEVPFTPANPFVKITQSHITGKISELRVSKSLIKQLLHKGEPYPVCPNKVYHTLLLRDVTTPLTGSLLKGLYFESKCIGSSADGGQTYDLPRHARTGAKLADHERIDKAVELFFSVVTEYGMNVNQQKTQVYKKRPWIDHQHSWDIPVFIDGTLDFVSPITTPRYSFAAANVDLKLTKDRDAFDFFSTGLYHPVPWGKMENADFTEAMLYRELFELPFVYLVFDYKKENPGFKDIPIITDINDPVSQKAAVARSRQNDLSNSIRWVSSSILGWEKAGWPMEPLPLLCNGCPLVDCPKRAVTIEV